MGTRGKCSLNEVIDGASGNITGFYFRENKCLNDYFEVKRQITLEYGLPFSIYVCQHTILRPNNAKNWKLKP